MWATDSPEDSHCQEGAAFQGDNHMLVVGTSLLPGTKTNIYFVTLSLAPTPQPLSEDHIPIPAFFGQAENLFSHQAFFQLLGTINSSLYTLVALRLHSVLSTCHSVTQLSAYHLFSYLHHEFPGNRDHAI